MKYISKLSKAFLNVNFSINNFRPLSTLSLSDNLKCDVLIVGTGIVGLGTAQEMIQRYPSLKFIVVDKENVIAAHQSGHNSGVIHAGIYYTPGSVKAKLCVEGLKLSYKYFDEHEIPYKKVGKLIVATSKEEVIRLDALYDRGLKNEVPDLKVIESEGIKEIEPNCIGFKALHSPHTGIVDWGYVTKVYGKNFESKGGKIIMNFEVSSFSEAKENLDYPVLVTGLNRAKNMQPFHIQAKYVIACAGLHADIVAKLTGCKAMPKIVPFRGEYLLLKKEMQNLVRGNIYPVPNPKFPFLGVHFTPRMNGEIWLGPNAVLAFKREGYKLFDISLKDTSSNLLFPGLSKLVLSNLGYAFGELYRGIRPAAQVKILQKFVPSLKVEDVVKGPSGVRAQALDNSGNLVDDFIFDCSESTSISRRTLHVRNAPSPAATSSLAIAKVVADKAKQIFSL